MPIWGYLLVIAFVAVAVLMTSSGLVKRGSRVIDKSALSTEPLADFSGRISWTDSEDGGAIESPYQSKLDPDISM
jgi:hypothetical protein